MKELAIDTLNKTKVIISRDRKNRPMDNVLDESCNSRDEYDETCPFCRGNEKNIEEETFVINKNSKWIVKSVRNKYPIIDNNKLNKIKGEHDVIIDNYKHNANFYNMSEEEFYYLLLMYKNRYIDFKEDKNIKSICLFKNYLRQAGASLMHPHSQIISLPFIPPILKKEYEACEEFYEKMGINMYENIIRYYGYSAEPDILDISSYEFAQDSDCYKKWNISECCKDSLFLQRRIRFASVYNADNNFKGDDTTDNI